MRQWRSTFYDWKLLFIYRIHEDPKAEKVQEVYRLCFLALGSKSGWTVSEMSHKKLLQEIAVQKVEGEPLCRRSSMMLLRSMQQARYSEHNHGYLAGFVAEFYTTLPCVPSVGYPDLMVHRMVREYGNPSKKWLEQVLFQTLPANPLSGTRQALMRECAK